MAFIPRFLFLSLLALSILHVKCDDEDLVRGINQYRTSLNLTALTINPAAECVADEVAERFKTQPCNTTIPTLPRPSDYPNITRCNLNAATINNTQILPICVPDNEQDRLLLNRTITQYMSYLNGTQFSGIGIGSEDDWTVVVLTTSTPNGNSPPASGTTPPPPASGTTPPPPGSGSTPPPPASGSTPGSGSSSPPPPAGNSSSPGSGGSNPSNGVSGLIAISPITVILIGLFVLV